MKRLMTALGICALLCSPAGAADYTWDGGYSSSGNWTEGDNWVGGVAPPRASGSNRIFIDAQDLDVSGGLQTTAIWNVGGGGSPTYLSISVTGRQDGNSTDRAMTFKKSSSKSMTVADFYVTSGTGGSSYSQSATLWIANTGFAPTNLDIVGHVDSPALLDIDASFTVASNVADATIMASYVEANVAPSVDAYFKDTCFDADGTLDLVVQGSGETLGDFKTDEFRVEHASDTAITVTKSGAGKINADSVVIAGQTNQAATLIVSAGSIVTR